MATPAAKPAAPAAPPAAAPVPPPPPPPLSGEVRDAGASRHDAVRALRWGATGGSKVLGDVEVDVAELTGTISVRGKLTARQLTVRGSLDVGGELKVAEQATVLGSIRCDGAASAGALRVDGAGTFSAAVKVERSAEWKGTVDVTGDLSAGTVEFEGAITATGDLAAPTVVGRLRGKSHVENLKATSLTLTRPGLVPPLQTGSLTVVRIDAGDAKLAGVQAEFVKATTIDVGPGCHLAAVEGQVTRIHSSSHVGPESRSPKPHGLSR